MARTVRGTNRINTVLGLASIPFALLVWEAVSRSGIFNPGLFPPPSKVLLTLVQLAMSGQLVDDVLATGRRMLLGYLMGAFAGLAVGILTGRSLALRSFLYPIIQMLRPVPPISFVPIAILWFGLGEASKYFLVFWGVFFVVWINTHIGVTNVPRIYLEAAQNLGASERGMVRQVVLPAALPMLLAGLRTAIPIGFYSLVAAEIAGAYSGVAYMIEIAHTNFQIDKMFSGLVVLGIGSALADRLFVAITTRAFPWIQMDTAAH